MYNISLLLLLLLLLLLELLLLLLLFLLFPLVRLLWLLFLLLLQLLFCFVFVVDGCDSVVALAAVVTTRELGILWKYPVEALCLQFWYIKIKIALATFWYIVICLTAYNDRVYYNVDRSMQSISKCARARNAMDKCAKCFNIINSNTLNIHVQIDDALLRAIKCRDVFNIWFRVITTTSCYIILGSHGSGVVALCHWTVEKSRYWRN